MLEFSFRKTGVDDASGGHYSTAAIGLVNATIERYGFGSPEAVMMGNNAFLASFLCHIIIYQNEKAGTTNDAIPVLNYVAGTGQDAYMFSDCLDFKPAYQWIIDILLTIGVLNTVMGSDEYSLSLNVLWAPSDEKRAINIGLDAGEVAACMNSNYSVGLDVTPYTCNVVPCGSICPIFDVSTTLDFALTC